MTYTERFHNWLEFTVGIQPEAVGRAWTRFWQSTVIPFLTTAIAVIIYVAPYLVTELKVYPFHITWDFDALNGAQFWSGLLGVLGLGSVAGGGILGILKLRRDVKNQTPIQSV